MTADQKFLKQARDRFALAEAAEKDQRTRELDDLRFYAGEQWDKDLLDSRKGQTLGTGSNQQVVPARPSLTINKTREPVRQVLNQERQSDLGIELIPADDWGETTGPIDHTEIELREGLVRRIQRDSEAADARTWAFARAAIAGRGYYLVMTRYVPGKTWDQEIYVERLYNQATVLLDPAHEQPDGSDADWGFYGTDLPWDVYKAQYPSTKAKRNKISDCANDTEWRAFGDEAPGWFKGEGDVKAVRVMNYYYTERTSRDLALLEDGSVAWADELADGITPKETRTVVEKTIKWAKIDGCQVLDETEWPGHWLPIIKVLGEELQPFDQQRRAEGIVRPMRDPCKGNNYIVSKFVERVGLTPIPPIMMAGGQDEGYEDEYNAINTRTLGRVHYNQTDGFDRPAPPPFRIDSRSEIADIAMGVQVFGQAIASTSVTPETALGNVDPTVKSGRLAKALIEQAQRGTSNFLDNLVRSMRHEARVINDLLYPIYNRPGRLARMMNGQGEMSAVLIGQPFTMQGAGKQAKPIPVPEEQQIDGAKLYQLTPDCDFNVAVKISKNMDTRRQEISQFLAEIVSASPEEMRVVGDKLWQYLDVPDHEEFAERYKVLLLPPIQQLISGQTPLPPEAQAQIAALQQQLAALKPMADKNLADLEKAKLEDAGESRRLMLSEAFDTRRAREDNETKLAVAELGAKVDRLALFLEERARLGVQGHDAGMAAADRQHQVGMAQLAHAQALEQGTQDQANALEQGAQAHQQALEVQAAQPAETP
jgi:hypothetical protein